MAEDVSLRADPELVASAPTPVLVEPIASRGERARRSSYRLRFGIVYVFLGALVAAAVGTFVVLLLRPTPPEAAAWSSWRPEGSALEKMQQIADRIPKTYLMPNSDELNIAIARNLVARVDERSIPVGAIIVEPGSTAGTEEGDGALVYDAAETVGIALCGLGPSCSIPGGESSDATFAVRRQALELALYAFKYVDEVESVLVFMPLSPKGDSGGAIFLRRDDIRDELRTPLTETLPVRTSQIVGEATPEELAVVTRLTDSRLFAFTYEPAPDGNLVMVLAPPTRSG